MQIDAAMFANYLADIGENRLNERRGMFLPVRAFRLQNDREREK